MEEATADGAALTLKIVSDTLFGDDEVPPDTVAESFTAVLERFDGLRALLPSWLPFCPFARYRKAITRLETVVYDVLARRHDRQLRDEIISLMIAGHDTVANGLTWTWYLLARHPEAEQKMFAEADALTGPPIAADLARLPYTRAVFNESLRLYPPTWTLSREVVGEWDVAGFPAERGMRVSMCPWVVHRNPRFFLEPLCFRPERWLDGSTKNLPTYAYFPFGGGQRLCIGRPFALLQGVLVLTSVAQRFQDLGGEPPFTTCRQGPSGMRGRATGALRRTRRKPRAESVSGRRRRGGVPADTLRRQIAPPPAVAPESVSRGSRR